MISDLHDIVERALTSNYLLFEVRVPHKWNASDETRWNCDSSLSCAVPAAPPSVPCHQSVLQGSHGRASEVTSIVSSLTVGCCSCFTELGSGLLVGGIADTRTPVWLVVRGTHVMKMIWNHYKSAKSDNNCQLSLCFDLKKKDSKYSGYKITGYKITLKK